MLLQCFNFSVYFLKFNILAFPLIRNGIYPLMNFASTRPHPVPRALSLSQEQVETVKTPTPEPQETETRKVGTLDWTTVVLNAQTCWLHIYAGYISREWLCVYSRLSAVCLGCCTTWDIYTWKSPHICCCPHLISVRQSPCSQLWRGTNFGLRGLTVNQSWLLANPTLRMHQEQLFKLTKLSNRAVLDIVLMWTAAYFWLFQSTAYEHEPIWISIKNV